MFNAKLRRRVKELEKEYSSIVDQNTMIISILKSQSKTIRDLADGFLKLKAENKIEAQTDASTES